jgi:hypothetical protein
VAVSAGKFDVVQKLVESGHSLEVPNKGKILPNLSLLHFAVLAGDMNILSYFLSLKKLHVDIQDQVLSIDYSHSNHVTTPYSGDFQRFITQSLVVIANLSLFF